MGYYDLLAIIDEARQLDIEYNSEPPLACPNDGTLLERGPRNELFCKFDGWVWNGMNNQTEVQ